MSAQSGIPTFRGEDGFWTIGSKNYTPQQMATRHMYKHNPAQFLLWYYKRFATYRNHGPNAVHYWLADKNLITQNIDGLDGKAGNADYISIHGRLDKMTTYHEQGDDVELFTAPYDLLDENLPDAELIPALLDMFKIVDQKPQKDISYKPYVLLFDELYTELYRINEAHERMYNADKIIFMGTSFSVNITQMALDIAQQNYLPIEIVDPSPVKLQYDRVTYHQMTALEYIETVK
ncbi:MAG: hypothetical protein OCD03_00145 [Hyphomicrobiales bacterium]